MSYNGILISNLITVSGFDNSYSMLNSIQSCSSFCCDYVVANDIDKVLKQQINISKYLNMSNITAATSLNSYLDDMKTAILLVLQRLINSESLIWVEQHSFCAPQIINNITITFPSGVSLQDNESGEIKGVILSYKGIRLTGGINYTGNILNYYNHYMSTQGFTNAPNTFIIDGFKTITTNTHTSTSNSTNQTNKKQTTNTSSTSNSSSINLTNNQIANKLDSLLSNAINLSDYYATVTTTNISLNTNALKNAIILALNAEIINGIKSSNLENIISNAITNYLTIKLPKYITLTDYLNGEISNIEFSYKGIQLHSDIDNSNTFIAEGFIDGSTASKKSNTAQIITKLDSLLSTYINIGSYLFQNQPINIYQVGGGELASSTIIAAIKSIITSEIDNSNNSITINNTTYTTTQIVNNISIILPNNFSNFDCDNGQIPDVELLYNGRLSKF